MAHTYIQINKEKKKKKEKEQRKARAGVDLLCKEEHSGQRHCHAEAWGWALFQEKARRGSLGKLSS